MSTGREVSERRPEPPSRRPPPVPWRPRVGDHWLVSCVEGVRIHLRQLRGWHWCEILVDLVVARIDTSEGPWLTSKRNAETQTDISETMAWGFDPWAAVETLPSQPTAPTAPVSGYALYDPWQPTGGSSSSTGPSRP